MKFSLSRNKSLQVSNHALYHKQRKSTKKGTKSLNRLRYGIKLADLRFETRKFVGLWEGRGRQGVQ